MSKNNPSMLRTAVFTLIFSWVALLPTPATYGDPPPCIEAGPGTDPSGLCEGNPEPCYCCGETCCECAPPLCCEEVCCGANCVGNGPSTGPDS